MILKRHATKAISASKFDPFATKDIRKTIEKTWGPRIRLWLCINVKYLILITSVVVLRLCCVMFMFIRNAASVYRGNRALDDQLTLQ